VTVVAVGAAGITAGLGQQQGAEERWDDAFARAHGAHVAVFGNRDTMSRIGADSQVVQAAGPAAILDDASVTIDGRKLEDVGVRAAGQRRPRVATPLLHDGRWLSGGDPGEAVVERSFALEEGIAPGSRLVLEGPGGRARVTVTGIALDLLDCFYPECSSATVWAEPAVLSRLDPRGSRTQSLLLARLANPEAVGAFESRVQDAYAGGVTHILDWKDTRSDALGLNRFFAAFLGSFGVFLLVAAGLVILSAVSARVLAAYRELGILKAVGFTPRALTLIVLGENLLLASVGAAIGIATGYLLAPGLELDVASVLGGGSVPVSAGTIALALGTVLGIVTAATVVPAWRAGRIPASRAIGQGAAPVSVRPSRIARLAVRLRLGPPAVVGLKDAAARPLRAWLSIATLAVTVIAIVATLAMDRTVSAVVDDPALSGDPFDLELDAGDAPPGAVARALDREPGVRDWFTVTDRRGAVGNATFLVRALGGNPARTGFVVREGRMPAGPGEVVAGYGLLRLLDRDVGDRMPLELGGERLDLRIVGRYQETEDSGEVAQIRLAGLRRVEPAALPGAYLVRVERGQDPRAVARRLSAAGGSVQLRDTDTSDFDAFRFAFYGLSALVLALAAANLLAATVLGIRERIRDVGVLKTIGFTPAQVVWSVAVGTAATSIVAVLIGVPAGLIAADLMLEAVGRGAGIGPELGDPPGVGGVVLAAAGIVLLAAGIGALVARRAARAQVADVLRAE
jgi:putative ABC transport system permease protein